MSTENSSPQVKEDNLQTQISYEPSVIEEYLQRNNVFQILSELCQSLAINKPKSPLEHMTKILSNPIPVRTFMVGPRSLVVEEIAKDSTDEDETDIIIIKGSTP